MSDKKEWRGPEDGLPPADTECEYLASSFPYKSGEFWPCVYIGEARGYCYVLRLNEGPVLIDRFSVADVHRLRPIVTKKEKQIEVLRDLLANAPANLEDASGFYADYDLAEAVYAAGFRLTEPPE